jgi:ABC-type antimicrobial peptide transport system permease subunit
MEEESMTIAIIGIIIGVLVFGAGIYYLTKEKEDPESKKIYSIIAAVGALIVVGMVLKLVLF